MLAILNVLRRRVALNRLSAVTQTIGMSATATNLRRPMSTIPRPSSSLVVVNANNEILLVHRNPDSRSFAGVHVFPGGNYDEHQDTSLEMTAIRETFEESGILFASPTSPAHAAIPEHVLDEARKAIHAQTLKFPEFLAEHGLEPDTASLLPFTQWITPAHNPRRFHTHFYVVFLPSVSTLAGPTSGDLRHRLPTPDGGLEVISARFIHPLAALAEFHAGSIALMPPQVYLISTLATCLGEGRTHNPAHRAAVERLSLGPFGAMILNPRALPGGDGEGRTVLTYEGDETRGGKVGRLHRSVVRFGKGGIPTEVNILRNFDIFTEIETHLFSKPAKL